MALSCQPPPARRTPGTVRISQAPEYVQMSIHACAYLSAGIIHIEACKNTKCVCVHTFMCVCVCVCFPFRLLICLCIQLIPLRIDNDIYIDIDIHMNIYMHTHIYVSEVCVFRFVCVGLAHWSLVSGQSFKPRCCFVHCLISSSRALVL